jgi:stalled ribosome rescue protein Dom34
MKTFHAAVWLDHSEARVFHIDKVGFDETVIVAEKPHRHIHRKSGPGAVSGRRAAGDPAFYEEVAKALTENEEILVLGPSTAKLELIKYVHKHHAPMASKVVGVETVDHPTDRQIVAYARHYFDVVDNAK